MSKWGSTAGLKAISACYVLSASAFGFAMALQAQQPWAVGVHRVARATPPFLSRSAVELNESALKPAWAFTAEQWRVAQVQISSWVAGKKPVAEAPKLAQATIAPHTVHRAPSAAPAVRPAITAPAKPQTAQAPVAPVAKAPDMQLAQREAETPELMPAPDTTPPSPAEVSRVLTHLRTSLSKELYDNFALFLYVSKAEHGPWHQRMFVFAKQDSGDLKLSYSFPVSTGREILTAGPTGKMLHTNTPPGIYQLDPERMYKRYTSGEWQHKMPFAMFFNWEHDGLQTGLAIHSAVGPDIADLGKRASAGCVRLAPQNAELLFQTIKKNYRGLTPRFAYDRRTATMSNDGLLMHDKAGNIQYQDGYRVLVVIENNGGDDVIAALF